MPAITFQDDPSLATFLQATVPMAEADAPTTRFLRVNDAFCSLTGRTAEELRRLTYLDLTHPDDRARDREIVERCLGGHEEHWSSEKRYVRPDGTVRWVVVLGGVMRRHGRPWRTVAIVEDITARKEAELAARTSEQLFRVAQELSQQAFTVLRPVRNADGRIVDFKWSYANPAAHRLLGRPGSGLVGRRLLEELPGPWGSALFDLYLGTVETGRPAARNLRCQAGGVDGWLSHSAVKLEDGVAVSFWDITPLKRAEQAARERIEELQTLMDALPVAVFVAKDAQCSEVVGNRAAYELVRQPPGANVLDSVDPPDAAPHLRIFSDGRELQVSELPVQQAAALGIDVNNAALEHVFDDGHVLHLFGNARPLFDEAGKVRGAVGVYLDVSERRKAEEQLRAAEQAREEQRQLLEKLIATTPLGIALMDPRTSRYVLVNPAYQRITGRDSSIVGLTLAEVFPGLAVTFATISEQILTGRESVSMREQPLDLAGDGTTTWWNVESVPILDDAGGVEEILFIVQEITEEVRAQTERERLLEEAREANRLKDEFLATLSHELRTPLNAILGWSQLLQDSGDEALRGHGLQAIARNASAQARLVEDILDASRIASGRMSLELRPMDLAPVVKAAVEAVRPLAEAKGLALECAIEGRARVNADDSRLEQIFWNVLSNAVKFTPAGRIAVRVETDADQARVVIDDTGIGIDPSFLPSIFDRFSQADGSSTRQYGGLGLGLAIVRQLTELHGGRVEATSAGRGQGTRFTITLPRADRGEPTPGLETDRTLARAADAASRGELEGLRILVVDDDADELELLHAILEAKAARVTTTASAAEAFAAFEREPFDVVISDIGMPAEDGYSLLRRIRALPAAAGGGVCAIALTAYARSTDRLAALAAGFHQHVAKPVSPNELTGVVASLVRNLRRPVELG